MRLGHFQIREENKDSFRGEKQSTWQRLKHRYARMAARATALFAFVFSVGGLPACNYYQPLVSADCDGSHCNSKDGGVSDGKDGDISDGGLDGGMGDDGMCYSSHVVVAQNLIGDFLNRRLVDRKANVQGDTDSEYQLGGPDTPETANPFTDGAGGSIGLANSFLYRVDGSHFSSFADVTLTDVDSGDSYAESQALWLQGSNHFSPDPDDIVGRLNLVVYTLKFSAADHEAGIPVCTAAEGNDFTYCKTMDAPDADIDHATETHRVKVYFLGEQWLISEMNAPQASLPYDGRLVNGGSVKLAKEAISGIIEQGESLPMDGLRFQLDDLEDHEDGSRSAIISVLDADGNVLMKDKIDPRQTRIFVIDGKEYKFHVWKVAPGYTLGVKWADVAIFFKELELRDGQNVDHDNGLNPEYSTILGWKNIHATEAADRPDALRTIIIFSEDIEDLSTNGRRDLEAGDSIPLIQDPAVWDLTYRGLDVTSSDRYALSFEMETTDREITAGKGPIIGGQQVGCVIRAPYIKVVSSDTGSVFMVERSDANGVGGLSDDEFLVTLNNGAACDADFNGDYETGLASGTAFMKVSPSSADYGIAEYATNGFSITYSGIGSDESGSYAASFDAGGAIHIETRQDVERGAQTGVGDDAIGDMLESEAAGNSVCTSGECADFYVAIAELAGTGASIQFVDYWLMGVARTGSPVDATFDFDSLSNWSVLTSSSEELKYCHATPNKPNREAAGQDEFYDPQDNTGPVENGMEMVEEGYISERGSVFVKVDSRTVEFDMTHKLARAVWVISDELFCTE